MKYEAGEFILGETRVPMQNVLNALYNLENYFTRVKRQNGCAESGPDDAWKNPLGLSVPNNAVCGGANAAPEHAIHLKGTRQYFDFVGTSVFLSTQGGPPVHHRIMKSWPTSDKVIKLYRDCAEKTLVPFELLQTPLRFNVPSLFTLATNAVISAESDLPCLERSTLSFFERTKEHFQQNRYTFNLLESNNIAYHYLYGPIKLSHYFTFASDTPHYAIKCYSELIRYGRRDLAFYILPFISLEDRDLHHNNILMLALAANKTHYDYLTTKFGGSLNRLYKINNKWGVNATLQLNAGKLNIPELLNLHQEMQKSLKEGLAFQGHVLTATKLRDYKAVSLLKSKGAFAVNPPGSGLITIGNPFLFLSAQHWPEEQFVKFFQAIPQEHPHNDKLKFSYILGACFNKEGSILPFLLKIYDIKQFSIDEFVILFNFINRLTATSDFGGLTKNLPCIYTLLTVQLQVKIFKQIVELALKHRQNAGDRISFLSDVLKCSIKIIGAISQYPHEESIWHVFARNLAGHDESEIYKICTVDENRLLKILYAYLNLTPYELSDPGSDNDEPLTPPQFFALKEIFDILFCSIGCDASRMNLPLFYSYFTDAQQAELFQLLAHTAIRGGEYDSDNLSNALPGIIASSRDIIRKMSAPSFWHFILDELNDTNADREAEFIAEFLMDFDKTGIDSVDAENMTPLHMLYSGTEFPPSGPKVRQLVQMLLALHDVNIADSCNTTLMHLLLAATCHAICNVEFNKDGPDEKCVDDHISWIKTLLKRFAHINLANKAMVTPFYQLIEHYSNETAPYLPYKIHELVDILLEAGALAHITPPEQASILVLIANNKRLLFYIIGKLQSGDYPSRWEQMIDPTNFNEQAIKLHQGYYQQWMARGERGEEEHVRVYQGESWDNRYIATYDEEHHFSSLSMFSGK